MPAPAEFAVLVPIIEHAGAPSVLLTRRPDTLPQYSGHVAFPGGARDPRDADLVATAIREAQEEVGIKASRITVIAELPVQATGIGHRVKPFVARVAPGPIVPNPAEVARVFYLPLSIFESDPFVARTWIDPAGKTRSTHTFLYEGHEIWGLTARILRLCFVEKILGIDHGP